MTERTRHRWAYGAHPSQWADLTLPSRDGTGEQPLGVCLVVHGGFWRQRYDASLGAPLAHALAAHGIAAVNVEYRRVGGAGGWPTTCLDVAAALDSLADLPTEVAPRLDLERVVALGHSAGGQLVGWLAGQPAGRVRLRGFVSQAGVLDLQAAIAEGLGDGAVEAFLGEQAIVADVLAASPIALLPTEVASVLVHGDADADVPLAQSQRYHRDAVAAGDDCRLEVLPGGDHYGVITPESPDWVTCRQAVADLLMRG